MSIHENGYCQGVESSNNIMKLLKINNLDCFSGDNYHLSTFNNLDTCIKICEEYNLKVFIINNNIVYYKKQTIKECVFNIIENENSQMYILLNDEKDYFYINDLERVKFYTDGIYNNKNKYILDYNKDDLLAKIEESKINKTDRLVQWTKQHYTNFLNFLEEDDFNFNINPYDCSSGLDLPTFVKSRSRINKKLSVILPLEDLYNPKFYKNILNKDIQFKDKIKSCVWRGANSGCFWINKNHNDFLRASRKDLVVKHAKNEKYNIGLSFANYSNTNNEPFEGNINEYIKGLLDIKEMLKYMFLISVEGNDFATNLSWIMLSNSVPMMPTCFIETWKCESKLIPYVHYIPLKNDFSDLDDQISWGIQNLDKCEEIAFMSKMYILQFFDIQKEEKIIKDVLEVYKKNVININSPIIIGYIHICQNGNWQKSFKMLIDSIKKSNLYYNTSVIRLGIVNDSGILIKDDLLNDDKFDIIYIGKSSEYERPTLLHMHNKSKEDNINTRYYYLHTKGIRHFGKKNEQCIIDWINLMLFWNIENWKLAIKKLETYDTYGCNDIGWHYSGNFWWSKQSHIIKLPSTIDENYNAPEDWVQKIKTNKYCVYNSGLQGMGHYDNLFSRDKYCNVKPYSSNIIESIKLNNMYEIGLKYNSDKITHHNYHEIYDLYLKSLYDKEGSILEIGIQHGYSLSMWLELFKHAFIYGMDISLNYKGPRHNIIKGDQSKIEDLNNVKNIIKNDNIFFINDDGSHIPEHQLLTFNTLFPILSEGGIYIIEDIETSYWTKNGLYGYETRYGYKHKDSIIEIFKDVIDSINSEFAGKHINRVHHHDKICSITFSKNCIIIIKKTKIDRLYRFINNL